MHYLHLCLSWFGCYSATSKSRCIAKGPQHLCHQLRDENNSRWRCIFGTPFFFSLQSSNNNLAFKASVSSQSGGSARKSGPSGRPASPPNSCGAAFVWFGGPVAPASIQGFHTSLTHFSLPGFLLTGHKLTRGRGRWRSDSQEKKKKKKDQDLILVRFQRSTSERGKLRTDSRVGSGSDRV